MKITEYRQGEYSRYHEDLKYWSNACGELHHHGEYDITVEDLPKELKRAYEELWSENTGSYCYLVEYKGEYKIALINEFCEDDLDDVFSSMCVLYSQLKHRAKEYSAMEEFKDAGFILAEEMGFDGCHEFITLLPCDMEKKKFDRVADILYKTVYEYGDVKEVLAKKDAEKPLSADELRVTGLFYMKTLPGETKNRRRNDSLEP